MARRSPAGVVERHCLVKPGVTLEHPWGEDTFKVGGKVFVFTQLRDRPLRLGLRADPERIPALLAVYPGVTPPEAYLDRSRWVIVSVDERIPFDEVLALVDRSYELVAGGLSRRRRAELGIRLEAPSPGGVAMPSRRR